jgi:cytidine deaminase
MRPTSFPVGGSDVVCGLLAEAEKAREKAYAPYSRFAVGAALLGKSGRVYPGCNIENASYGATICAERAALANAVSQGEREFSAIAIVADTADAPAPCGICRQVLAEFGIGMTVVMGNLGGQVRSMTLETLYPGAFGKSALGMEHPISQCGRSE